MKAVFVRQDCVLRDSHIAPTSPSETWRLMPATLEAMRLLATDEMMLFIYCAASEDSTQPTAGDSGSQGLEALVKQVEAAGGRVDGLICCPHGEGTACKCWSDFPGVFWVVASQLGLRLNECYVLADTEQDVITAYTAGARPIMVLCQRSIGEVLGNLPHCKDFPIATDLTTAVNYITVEEEIARQLGRVRNPAPPVPPEEVLYADREALPTFRVTSPLAQGLQTRLHRTRAELRDIVRWLSFFVLGAVGLSLGIAYMLTHFYRVQPFPEFAYYVTLQFISRPLRGALFIALGIGAIVLTLRSFYRTANFSLWPKRKV